MTYANLLILAGVLLIVASLLVLRLLLMFDEPEEGRMRDGWYPNRERQRVDAARGK